MLMLLTATRGQATELGDQLGLDLDEIHEFGFPWGSASVHFSADSEQRCSAALFLQFDLGLFGGRGDDAREDDETPPVYAAPGMLADAIRAIFRYESWDITQSPLPLEILVPQLRCRADRRSIERILFPLDWDVEFFPILLDQAHPEWGDTGYGSLILRCVLPLRQALSRMVELLLLLDGAPAKPASHSDGAVGDDAEPMMSVSDFRPAVGREGLAIKRLDAVLGALAQSGATRVVDLGCGTGVLLASLAQDGRYIELVGVDGSARSLQSARRRMHLEWLPVRQRSRIKLIQSSILEVDPSLIAVDAAVLMEVIEHLEPPHLPTMADNLFGRARYSTVIVTTPNLEHTIRYPAPTLSGLRHDDHKFEWTRREFCDWASEVSTPHGYTVRIEGVGECDADVGCPTQMAVFTRADGRP